MRQIIKLKENYQTAIFRAQNNNQQLLTLSELMNHISSNNITNDTYMSGSAIIIDNVHENIILSPNFSNGLKIKPENIDRCNLQIKSKDRPFIHGDVLSLKEYNSNIGMFRLHEALENKILLGLVDKNSLCSFMNSLAKQGIYQLNINLPLSNASSFVYAKPVGFQSNNLITSFCETNYYLIKNK